MKKLVVLTQVDAWLRRISANNLLNSFRKCHQSLKDTITAMSSSLWTTLKRFGINLHFRQSLYYIIPSTWSRRSSHKNVCSFISRSSKRTPNQFDLLRQIRAITQFHALVHFGIVTWLCCYSCMFATELMVFFVCFDWFFLMLFFLFPSVHYHSNMHACMFFFFFKKDQLSIHPAIHSFTFPPIYLSI